MTTQRSEIVRAFARGESIVQIAESCGVSYGKAWSQIRRAVAELDRKGGTALDAIRWQNYLMLMRVADQALAAFEKSAEDGVSEIASQTIESRDDCGKLRLTGKRVTRSVRRDAGDVRFLEMALKALHEIRNLFGIGAEAETKLRAVSPEGDSHLRRSCGPERFGLRRAGRWTCVRHTLLCRCVAEHSDTGSLSHASLHPPPTTVTYCFTRRGDVLRSFSGNLLAGRFPSV
jgi:hypothetical protein